MSRRAAEAQGFAERVRDFTRQRRGWMFAVPATAFAVLVIVAAINLDKGSARSTKKSRIDGAAELLPPQLATAEELARASGASADQTAVSLAAGAWVQVADENGRLAQEYNATKLEPLPGSQLSMREPRAKIYLKDGRVLTLASRKGVAYAPRRALESGTLEDDVEVRLFRPNELGGEIDTDRDRPAVVVTADQAQFDGILGEVRCDRAVRVVTDAGSFAGEGLSLVLDADGDGLERLIVDRALEPIRIDRAARAMAADRRESPAAGGITDAVAGTVPDPRAAAPAPGAASTPAQRPRPTRRRPSRRSIASSCSAASRSFGSRTASRAPSPETSSSPSSASSRAGSTTSPSFPPMPSFPSIAPREDFMPARKVPSRQCPTPCRS